MLYQLSKSRYKDSISHQLVSLQTIKFETEGPGCWKTIGDFNQVNHVFNTRLSMNLYTHKHAGQTQLVMLWMFHVESPAVFFRSG